MKQNFPNNILVTDKTPFFVMVCSVLPTLFTLTRPSNRAVLFGNVAFSILVLSIK